MTKAEEAAIRAIVRDEMERARDRNAEAMMAAIKIMPPPSVDEAILRLLAGREATDKAAS
jgi:hypothetical protein